MSTSLDLRPRVKRQSIPANPVRHRFSAGVAACRNGFHEGVHSRCPPEPILANDTWGEFVRAHRRSLLAVDFFAVETVWLQRCNKKRHCGVSGNALERVRHLEGPTCRNTGLV
jgi:hypothetical protein